jgi:tRNA(Ile)-lysidine synthase
VLNLFLSENGKKIRIEDQNCRYNTIWKEEKGLYFESATDGVRALPRLIVDSVNTLPLHFSKTEIYVDANKVMGEITIRTWQEGDRIHPVGVPGSKLVSDVLKDAKVPLREKAHCLVIRDEQKLLAVVGHCVDRRAIAHTPPILKVQIKDYAQ